MQYGHISVRWSSIEHILTKQSLRESNQIDNNPWFAMKNQLRGNKKNSYKKSKNDEKFLILPKCHT